VVLARESGKVPEKDEQQMFLKEILESYGVGVKVQEPQPVDCDLLHCS
jgi:hypothetical protein